MLARIWGRHADRDEAAYHPIRGVAYHPIRAMRPVAAAGLIV